MKHENWECDKCRKVFKKEDVQMISVKLGKSGGYTQNYKELDLCDDCLVKVGLVREKDVNSENKKSVQDKLFDVICEIVDDSIDDRS